MSPTVQTFPVEGPLLLTPRVFGDARGFFFESWNERQWRQLLLDHGQESVALVQDNHSRSSRGVLRGLHYQLPPNPQGKLVRCVLGEIFDVAVDLRRSSPSFGQWVAAVLSAENQQQLWVPAGFAHGFLTLSEHAEVLYKTSDYWSKACERSIRWDDPQLAIGWPEQELPEGLPLLAEKDAQASSLAEALAAGDVFP
ncbi:MAG: dTDP-4-dehydrorhamnose 3,5-epimerase [Cyanobium sp.]